MSGGVRNEFNIASDENVLERQDSLTIDHSMDLADGHHVDGLPPVRQDGSRALQPLMRRRPARGEGAASTGWGSIDASTRCVCEQKKLEPVL